MLKKIKWMVVWGLLSGMAFAEPTVFKIDKITQRPESGIVDIMYDLIDPDCHEYFVELVVSNGAEQLPVTSAKGTGKVSTSYNRMVSWDAGQDWKNQSGSILFSIAATSSQANGCPYFGDPNATSWRTIKQNSEIVIIKNNYANGDQTYSIAKPSFVRMSVCPVVIPNWGKVSRWEGMNLAYNYQYAGYSDWELSTGVGVYHPSISLSREYWTRTALRRYTGDFSKAYPRPGWEIMPISDPEYTAYGLPVKLIDCSAQKRETVISSNFLVRSFQDPLINSMESSLIACSGCKFLEGVSIGDQVFTADIDWKGSTPSTIRFYKNEQWIQSGSSSTYTLNVSSWAAGDRLSVEAVAADGSISARKYAELEIIPRPFGLSASAFIPTVKNGRVSYHVSGITLFSSREGVETVNAEIDGDEPGEKSPFPLFDGKPCKYETQAVVDFVIESGYGRVSDVDFGGIGFKMGDFEISPELKEHVKIYYDSSAGKWIYSGSSEAVIAVDFPGIEIVTPFEGLLELEVGVSAELGEAREYTGWNPATGFEYEGSLLAGIGGKFSAGLGEDDLGYAALIWLKLMGNMELGFANDPVLRKIALEFSCGDKVVLGPFIGVEHVWYSHEFPIVDNRAHGDPIAMMSELAIPMDAVKLAEPDEPTFKLIPRTVGASESAPVALASPLALDSGSSLALSSELSDIPVAMSISAPAPVFPQTNVFQYVQTAFDASVSNACYLWNIDDPGRSSENRTVLKFSFDDGSSWSAPATVWEDGTGDYNPDVQVLDDGSAYALWANGKSALPEGATPDAMLEELEIAFAIYTPGSGWSCTNLTDNTVLDQSPKIAVADDGSAWAVWTRNEANNYKGSPSEPNKLIARYFDGTTWGEETVLATNLSIVASSSLVQSGNDVIYTCSLHSDDSIYSMDDTEIVQAVCSGGTWGPLTRLTDNRVRDISVQLKTTADGSPVAAWVQDDNLLLSRNSDFSSPQIVMSITNEPMAAYFDLLCGASNQIGMVWSSASVGGQDAFILNPLDNI